MIYKAKIETKNKLLSLPESGMGYQTISGIKRGTYNSQNFVVLNTTLIIDDSDEITLSSTVKQILNEGFENLLSKSPYIELNDIMLINFGQISNVLNEETETKKGAKDNKVEYANGEDFFVRLSAYDDDKRIDKINKKLIPGSYTTTLEDYKYCKENDLDPIELFALPNDDPIQWTFHIQPKKVDTLQKGTVQPAFSHYGGGDEVYFAKGTSNGTFLQQTPY